MIEPTEEQSDSMVNDRLADDGYDDSPWGPEEMDRLREESVALLDRYGQD